MPARVPILGQDHMGELARQPVDHGNDLIALWNCERSAGTEVVLRIDDQQDLSVGLLHCLPRNRGTISRAMIST